MDKAATELSLDRPTYEALTRLNVSRADAATRHYVEKTGRDFRRAGVDKDEATRARVKALREELVKLGQQFQANIASDVRTIELDPAELDGLPEDFKRAHPANGHGKVALTTNNTDYQPFLSYAKKRQGARRVLEDLPHARRIRRTCRCSAACSKRARSWRTCSASRRGPTTSPATR